MIPVNTPKLLLLDRNVVALIKDAVAGREITGTKKLKWLEMLSKLDISINYISPLLSMIEGEHGRDDSAHEKIICQNKESDVLRRFFKNAIVDSDYLDTTSGAIGSIFTTYREEQWNARENFFKAATPLVAQKVAVDKRREVEKDLIHVAKTAGLEADDGLVVLFLACLHGSNDARRVIKPTKPVAYNVLNDLHVISRVGFIKGIVKQTGVQMKVRFVTFDEGLEQVLLNIKMENIKLTNEGGLNMQVRYLPGLFPDLALDEFISLLTRLTN